MDGFNVLGPVDTCSPFSHGSLPTLGDAFGIPNLEEKPQNPIIYNLEKAEKNAQRTNGPFILRHQLGQALPKEPAILSDRILEVRALDSPDSHEANNIWEIAARESEDHQRHIASWDTLRSTYVHADTPSPFLTEQDAHVVNATRHFVNPRMLDPQREAVYVDAESLLRDLRSTLLACSSALHVWDSSSEQFIPTGASPDREKILIIVGMDEIVSQSFLSRFITIGSLLRRLEIFAVSLRQQTSTSVSDSTTYALGHALTNCTLFLRSKITLVAQTEKKSSTTRLSALWTSLSDIEKTLISLAELCNRPFASSPSNYPPLPLTSTSLLSHIYAHMQTAIDRCSPPILISTLAHILTVASRPFFRTVCRSVGFKGLDKSSEDIKRRAVKMRQELRAGLFGEGEGVVGNGEDGGEDEIDDLDDSEDIDSTGFSPSRTQNSFPMFMDKTVVDSVISARRSLKILFTYELEYGQTTALPDLPVVEWVWTEEEVESLLRSGGMTRPTTSTDSSQAELSTNEYNAIPGTTRYKPELASLAKFDLPPGSIHSISSPTNVIPQLESLPSLTPTLPTLTHTVFTPLLTHSSFLSRAALRIFMAPNTRFHFRAHLLLLRSYLLCTCEAFRSRMESALFEDVEWEEDVSGGQVSRKGRAVLVRRKSGNLNEGPWAIGLAQSLMDRGTWPPGGSDLGIALRHVIMDSVEDVRQGVFIRHHTRSSSKHRTSASVGSETSATSTDLATEARSGAVDASEVGCHAFWEDVEERLGFATEGLRDTGKEKWLDPTSIESLDFLYMVYKPPRPLDSLITEDILSKYRRVFTFLLRLMRVENALKTVFRLTRPSSPLLFPAGSSARKLLLTARFRMHAFLASLASYTYTTAIGGNVDAFLWRLQAAELANTQAYPSPEFSDVFHLMKQHSALLDDVMTACMLRTAQVKLRDLVKGCLECILTFAVLIGEVRRGRVGQGDAERRMNRINIKFEERVRVLVITLQTNASARSTSPPSSAFKPSPSNDGAEYRRAPGGVEALGDLVLRLEMSDWWRKATKPAQ